MFAMVLKQQHLANPMDLPMLLHIHSVLTIVTQFHPLSATDEKVGNFFHDKSFTFSALDNKIYLS